MRRGPWAAVSEVARLAVGVVWVWAGIHKTLAFDEFQTAVAGHGLIDPRLALVVPAFEVLLGIGVVAVIGSRLGRFTLALSVSLVILLSTYIALVPAPRLERSGCGCGLSWRGTHLEKSWLLTQNAGLLVLHGIASGLLGSALGGLRRTTAAP